MENFEPESKRRRTRSTVQSDSDGPSNQESRTKPNNIALSKRTRKAESSDSENIVAKPTRKTRRTVQADSEYNLPGPSNYKSQVRRVNADSLDSENIVARPTRKTRSTVQADSEYNLPGPSNYKSQVRRIDADSLDSENVVATPTRKIRRTISADSEYNLPEPISNQETQLNRIRTVTEPNSENNVVALLKRPRTKLPASEECNLPGPSNQKSQEQRTNSNPPEQTTKPIVSAGRIARVQLINFMCHANFFVEFNKNINIFVGNNGSGKSAIITAIVIGLGGNAVAAERSKNIAQLIRRGESSALIEITLLNDGRDSYEHAKYGNRIVVQRTIKANGSSEYRIKSENGKIITQKRRDLQNMVMYMNIQVDNPICVLNQDAARSFLKEADPRKLHLLFSKATQLENIIQINLESSNSYKSSTSKIPVLQQKVAKQNKDYRDAKDHYERLLSVDILKEELRSLKIELEWNKVIEEEIKYEEISNNLDEIKGNIEELKGSIESWDDDMNQFNKEKEDLLDEVTSIKAIIATNRLAHESLRTSRAERSSQMALQETKYKGMLGKVKRLEKDIMEMQKSIDDRQTSNRIEIMRRNNEEKLQILLAERDENQNKQAHIQKEVELLDNKSRETESKLDDLQHKLRNAKKHMDKTNLDINQIDVKSANNLSIFGNHVPNLVAAIEKHYQLGKFSELPRGPIGRYVQVKNAKWSRLIEHILGGQLQYFIFNTHEDGLYFDKLVKREFPHIKAKITKIVTKFCHTPYEVNANKVKVPHGSAAILFDEITVSDPVVLNVMIDQIHIEAILICSGNEEACKFTTEKCNVPKNLLKIFSLEPAAEYYPAPNFRSYGLDLRPSRLLQTDMKQYRLQLEHDLTEGTKVFKTVQSELNEFNQALKLSNAKHEELRANLLKIEKQLRRLQIDIEEIENFEYPAQHEIDVLQNELKELQHEYDKTKSAIENEGQNSLNLQQQVKVIEQDIKVNQAEVKKFEKTINEKMEQIDNITEKIDNLALNNVEADLKKYETERKKKEIEISKQKTILDTVTQRAAEKGERIETNRSIDKIQSLLKSTEKKIQKRCASTDDITTVKSSMITFETIYKNSESNLNEFQHILKRLSLIVEDRNSYIFYHYQPHVALRIKRKFARTLNLRKFGGELHIDHKNKTLAIRVIPQDKNIHEAVSNTKSLSGGERSYSTLAFLTSLWSCVSSPFYVLDEYDVFTDQINRRFMAQLLISEAKRQPYQQFCFFTPQDMSFVDECESITFHKLKSHLQST